MKKRREQLLKFFYRRKARRANANFRNVNAFAVEVISLVINMSCLVSDYRAALIIGDLKKNMTGLRDFTDSQD